MTYVAYLDEFGHIGPFTSRTDPKFKESPVFGLAGLILPATEIRSFGTWFFQRKQELLGWEIERAGAHPATWEKKGAALYTLRNVQKYRELRALTNRLFNKIEKIGGRVFYVGTEKTAPVGDHDPNRLYLSVLKEAIKRLDHFCEKDCSNGSSFLLVLDEHDQRQALVTAAAQAMYNPNEPRRRLIEPPFQVESDRYQTLQAADWIAGLVGRLGACWADGKQYEDWEPFRTYFEARLNRVSVRSGVRTGVYASFVDQESNDIAKNLKE
ncbi:DUF3800 domain-containing protein [Thalassospira lucentensis]|uniref:DUF3800 domain-containing protein n=1 Tax=Thalassospira lucentensis TaxID=168935 RepID=UPI003AA9DEEA